MRGNSVDLTHSSVLRPREHFESHCQWALFASKEQQTMKLEMGKSHIRTPLTTCCSFSSTPVKMKFLRTDGSAWKWQLRADSVHIWPRERRAEQRPFPCQSIRQPVSGTPSLTEIGSVFCLRGMHCRGAQKFLHIWIHLCRAAAAHLDLERQTIRALNADPHPDSACSLQKSVISWLGMTSPGS